MAPRDRVVLLFCHGGSFHKEIWQPIVRRLRATPLLQRTPRCECVAFDWRYHGSKRSDADAATIYYEDGDKTAPRVEHPGRHWPEWAPRDLLDVVTALRRDDAALGRRTEIVGIGHSMGAASLLHVQVHHPGSFAGLVLFEPPFAIGEPPAARKMAASVMVVSTLTREQEWDSWAEVVNHFQKGKRYKRWHPESLAAFLEGGVAKTGDGKRFRLAMPLIQEASLYCHEVMTFTHEQIARVGCRVVVEFGDHTRLFNLPLALDVARAVPEFFSVAEPLEGTTHLTVAEDPETCARHIAAALEKFAPFQRAGDAAASKL